MKIHRILITLLVLVSSIPTAYAQSEFEPTWGASGKVTATLTETWNVPTLFKKDETGEIEYELNEDTGKNEKILTTSNTYSRDVLNKVGDTVQSISTTEFGAKNTTRRYGNREILTELMLAGTLGEEVTSIKGWSIVGYYSEIMFDSSVAESSTRLIPKFYARHTDKTMIDISDMVVSVNTALMKTTSMKVSTTTTYSDESESSKTSHSYVSSYKGIVSLTVPTQGVVNGVITGKESFVAKSYSYYDIDPNDENGEKLIKFTSRSNLIAPGSVKLDKLIGTMTYDNGTSLLEGSVTISTPSIVDGDSYLAGPDIIEEEI
jgi:hypothetical protein